MLVVSYLRPDRLKIKRLGKRRLLLAKSNSSFVSVNKVSLKQWTQTTVVLPFTMPPMAVLGCCKAKPLFLFFVFFLPQGKDNCYLNLSWKLSDFPARIPEHVGGDDRRECIPKGDKWRRRHRDPWALDKEGWGVREAKTEASLCPRRERREREELVLLQAMRGHLVMRPESPSFLGNAQNPPTSLEDPPTFHMGKDVPVCFFSGSLCREALDNSN